MRLIDADEFIIGLKELYLQAGWGLREVHFSLADNISNIEMMPTYVVTATNVDWIPVNKKLPEDTGNGEVYLVTYKFKRKNGSIDYDVSTAFFTQNLHELDNHDFPDELDNRPGWYDYDSEAGFYEVDTDLSKVYGRQVIAWMPLPKPYHEEEE